jgi:hypothetical protein
MPRWKLQRERRRQKRKALLLLTVAGAVRPVDIVIRYRGTDRLLGTWSSESDLLLSKVRSESRSIWNTDIRQLWKTYRYGAAPECPPN